MCVPHHETGVEPVIAGPGPADDVTPDLHETPGAAVSQLIIKHPGAGLPARRPDPEVPGVLLALQCVGIPRFPKTIRARHREKRVCGDEVRGVTAEFRLHDVRGGIRGVGRLNVRLIRGYRRDRIIGGIWVVRSIRVIRRNRHHRSVRIAFAREVPVAPDFLQRVEISAGGKPVRIRFREHRV